MEMSGSNENTPEPEIDWPRVLYTGFSLGAFVLALLLSLGCTRITLPGGVTYTNFAQDKSYSVTYTDPETGDVLKADINVKNDPLIRALDVTDRALGLAEKGAPGP